MKFGLHYRNRRPALKSNDRGQVIVQNNIPAAESSVKCCAFMGYKSAHTFLWNAASKKQPWVSLKRVYDDTHASGPLTLGLMAVITTNLGAFAFGLSSHTHALTQSSQSGCWKRQKSTHPATNLGAWASKNAEKGQFSTQIQCKKTRVSECGCVVG